MKLLYSSASPYSSKVRMAARHLGIDIEAVKVDTAQEPALLVTNNPLGKIPTLILDDGEAVFDSVAIMRHFDRLSGGKLYPREAAAATKADVLESLGDGIADCLLASVYERRYRPEEKVHQGWIDRQQAKVNRALDHLQAHPPVAGESLTGGDFALAAALGYLTLRFGGQWEEGRPALASWLSDFPARFPAYDELKPQS